MKTANPVDVARIELLLADLRLPAIKVMWAKLAEQSDKEGRPRLVSSRRSPNMKSPIAVAAASRHLAEARLPVGKTLQNFEFEAVPMVSKAQLMALTADDSWLEKGANLLLLGRQAAPRVSGGSIGLALVQHLQIARRELALETALAKLDKYHLLILDDIGYVGNDQAETGVLFELIGSRYERSSMLITANQPFGDWGKVFPDQA